MWGDKQNADGSFEFESKGFAKRTGFKIDRQGFFNPNYTERCIDFDDFLGDILAANWSGAAAANGTAPAVVVGSNSGEVALVSGTGGNRQTNCSVLTKALNYKASNGNLVFEARVKISSISNSVMNMGFTDTLGTTTAEVPFTISGTTLTDTTSDGACFVFDDGQTAKNLALAATKANTEQVTILGATTNGLATAADTSYHVYRVEIDTNGHAKFYMDGVFVGGIANAVTPGTALTPVIVGTNDNTATKTVTVDYVYVAQDRV